MSSFYYIYFTENNVSDTDFVAQPNNFPFKKEKIGNFEGIILINFKIQVNNYKADLFSKLYQNIFSLEDCLSVPS